MLLTLLSFKYKGVSRKRQWFSRLDHLNELLKALQRCNIEIKNFGTGPAKSQEKVLRQHIQAYLAYQYEQLSVDFNRTQQEHSENIYTLQRKGITITEDDDEDDGEDEYLVSGGLMQAELGLDHRSAKERLREIRKIAKSVQDIKLMFMEISDMVTTQGTVLDRIDQNITTADMNVNVGVVNLIETNTTEGQSTKCWLAFLIIVIIFSIIIVIVIRYLTVLSY